MRKARTIVFAVATALVALGAALCIGAAALAGFDMRNLSVNIYAHDGMLVVENEANDNDASPSDDDTAAVLEPLDATDAGAMHAPSTAAAPSAPAAAPLAATARAAANADSMTALDLVRLAAAHLLGNL